MYIFKKKRKMDMIDIKNNWKNLVFQLKEIRDNANSDMLNAINEYLKLADLKLTDDNVLSVFEDGYYLTLQSLYLEDDEIVVVWRLHDGVVMESFLKDESTDIQLKVFEHISKS